MDIQAEDKRGSVRHIEHHRNGSGGMPFYRVDFTYDNEDLIGLIYIHQNEQGVDESYDNHTAVINPARFDDCKRGADYFGPWLFQKIQEHKKDRQQKDQELYDRLAKAKTYPYTLNKRK